MVHCWHGCQHGLRVLYFVVAQKRVAGDDSAAFNPSYRADDSYGRWWHSLEVDIEASYSIWPNKLSVVPTVG